jgi:outer membrane protein
MQAYHRLAELDLKRYRYAYLPTLSAFGSVSANASRNEFSVFNTSYKWFPTAIVGAQLNVPIWDGLQKRSRVQQSKLGLEKSTLQLTNFEQLATNDYAAARTSLENQLAVLETSKRNREIAGEIVRATKLKYDNGVGSSLEVVQAETSLKNAETEYFNALYQIIVQKLEVDRALGNITY